MDAPNVDGLIFVNADEMLMSGDFVRVKEHQNERVRQQNALLLCIA